MEAKDINTFDVYAKVWFDRINENSYNSCMIIINRGREDEIELRKPLAYGGEEGSIVFDAWKYAQDELGIIGRLNDIVVRKNAVMRFVSKGCTKREVEYWGGK